MNNNNDQNKFLFETTLDIRSSFALKNKATLYHGDCLDFLKSVPDQSIQLVVTSPPYNIGKEYEKKLDINESKRWQDQVIPNASGF